MEDKKKESLDTTLNECESSNKKIIDFIKDWWLIVVIIFVAILVIMQVKNFYFEKQDLYLISQEVESLGQMGDFFGGTLNPILAFLSFCLLLITIKLQSKELKNSTEELAKSSQALKEQSKSLQLQNFENTFFNMIHLHNEIIKNLYLEVKKKHASYNNSGNIIYYYSIIGKQVNLIEDQAYSGKNVITRLMEILNTYIKNDTEKDVVKLYNFFHFEYDNIISHYFRNIYQILKFVNKQEVLKDKDKDKELSNQKFYTNILRAQLSSVEFAFVFMNSLYKTNNKLFPLLVKYEFLEPLNIVDYYTNTSKPTEDIFKSRYIDNSCVFKAIEKCIQDTTNIQDENYPQNKIFGANNSFLKYLQKTNKETENE